jgi:hypothetical protein
MTLVEKNELNPELKQAVDKAAITIAVKLPADVDDVVHQEVYGLATKKNTAIITTYGNGIQTHLVEVKRSKVIVTKID